MAQRVKKEEISQEEINENEGLVPMTKDGAVLFVNPACIEAHKALDWQVAE